MHLRICPSDLKKACNQCGEVKSLSNFYKSPGMKDGHSGKCKECTKENVRSNRKKNIDYYRQYDRDRANRPDRVEARFEYSKTEAGKWARLKANRKWRSKNPEKQKAHVAVAALKRKGKLKQPESCEVCGKTKCRLEAHHQDYNKPFEVKWLCCRCHAITKKYSNL
jgi:hypothetical protein